MKISQGKEDYLKIIFKFNGYDQYVANKTIMNALGVSAPSVSDMLSKLDKDGMIEYIAYKGAKLTASGNEIAIEVIRKHRLSECFLFDVLGYKLEEVDQEAEQLEHIDSELFFDKLDIFLNHPKVCPHGGIIPSNGQLKETQNKSLTRFTKGAHLIIRRVIDNKNVLTHLEKLNISIGDKLIIDSRDDINEIIFFTINNNQNYISYMLAEMIFVEEDFF